MVNITNIIRFFFIHILTHYVILDHRLKTICCDTSIKGLIIILCFPRLEKCALVVGLIIKNRINCKMVILSFDNAL